MTIREELLSMQDLNYRDFSCRLMPGVPEETIIGVRTPQIRKLAARLKGTPEGEDFLNRLPHLYYEENNLHGFLIEHIGNFDRAVSRMEEFFPYINNWATCDSVSPKVFGRHPEALDCKIQQWMESDHLYTVRYAIGMRMRYFLEEHFTRETMDAVAAVTSDEYYVKMMVAWYFATALAKQYDQALSVLLEARLPVWTHNKAIQKAIESYRVPEDRKLYLRTLKRT